jgi:hypothetical protein
MKDGSIHIGTVNVSFSRRLVPYSYVFREDADHSINGVFVLYHLKRFRDTDDMIPLYLGYGNIATELKKLEERLKFMSHAPLFFDYIADPQDPAFILEALRHKLKPVLK